MAKRKRKKNSLIKRILQRIIRFFIPKEIRSASGWLWFGTSRFGASVIGFFTLLMLIFAMIPVPFSAYMAQKKVEHWITGEPYQIQYRWVSLDKISWQMQMAVIAAEDQKFESHFGVDLHAIEVALQRNSKSKKLRGGSTISQQTVKNMFLWHGQSWVRKGIELPLTFLLENTWGKERILEVYLNIAEFGEGIFGVESAAQHFFKKKAKDLNLQEASLLAASLPNPLIYRVNKPNAIMKKRQAWIIRQVGALGGQRYLEKL